MGNNGAIQPIKLGGATIYGNVEAKPIKDAQGHISFKVKDTTTGTELTYRQQKTTNGTIINFMNDHTKIYVTNMAGGDLVIGNVETNVVLNGCANCTVDASQNNDIEDYVEIIDSDKYKSQKNKMILGDNDNGYFKSAMSTSNKVARWFLQSKRAPQGKGTYNENDFYYGFNFNLKPENPFEKQSWR